MNTPTILTIENLRCRVNRGFVRMDIGVDVEQMLSRAEVETLMAWLAQAMEQMPK
jgi:hypothetical protein